MNDDHIFTGEDMQQEPKLKDQQKTERYNKSIWAAVIIIAGTVANLILRFYIIDKLHGDFDELGRYFHILTYTALTGLIIVPIVLIYVFVKNIWVVPVYMIVSFIVPAFLTACFCDVSRHIVNIDSINLTAILFTTIALVILRYIINFIKYISKKIQN